MNYLKDIMFNLPAAMYILLGKTLLTELVRTPESHSLITKIYPTSTVKQNYQKLDQDMWILFGNCL